MIKLVMATSILALINIVLGSLDAISKGVFDKKKLKQGIVKAIVVLSCVFGVYYSGTLVPDVMVIKINDVDLNLMSAVNVSGTMVFMMYGKQAIEKLVSLLTKDKVSKNVDSGYVNKIDE